MQPLDLITKDFHELRRIIKEKKESLERDQNKGKEKSKDSNRENEHELAYGKEKEVVEREKEKEEGKDKIEKGKEQENYKDKDKDRQQEQHAEKESVREHEDKIELKTKEHGISDGTWTLSSDLRVVYSIMAIVMIFSVECWFSSFSLSLLFLFINCLFRI